MTKSDLIMALAKKVNISEAMAIKIVSMIFDEFAETLKKGGRIEIRGFGSFSVRSYKPYTGRNPKTGKSVKVKQKRLPFFKVGRGLKERVDNK